jgi:hypothetical protein
VVSSRNVDSNTAWLLYAAPDSLNSSHGVLELMKLSDILSDIGCQKGGSTKLTSVYQIRLESGARRLAGKSYR